MASHHSKNRKTKQLQQLSSANAKTVIDYPTNRKNREPTQDLAGDSDTAMNLEPKAAGKNPIAQRIIEAVENSYDVTMEDAETLLRVIKEKQQPVQFEPPFKVTGHENQ